MKSYKLILLVSFFGLSGCSFGSNALWPALTGDKAEETSVAATNPSNGLALASQSSEDSSQTETPDQDTADQNIISSQSGDQGTTLDMPPASSQAPSQASPPALSLGQTNFIMPSVSTGQETGTFVGQKVIELRAELVRLQDIANQRNASLQNLRTQIVGIATRYHTILGRVSARLQTGTTPGNPILIDQWTQAQADLEGVAVQMGLMRKLITEVAADLSRSRFLLDNAQAAKGLQGAVDEDHVQIETLQDETNKTVIVIERLLNELTEDVRRQAAYLAVERSNLQTLASGITRGEFYGNSLANRAQAAAGRSVSGATQAQGTGDQRPVVVIEFDTPDVSFEQALYTALARTLERQPNAQFTVVSVAPGLGDAATVALEAQNARRYADRVVQSMNAMGLPAGRISLSATTSATQTAPQVQVFMR